MKRPDLDWFRYAAYIFLKNINLKIRIYLFWLFIAFSSDETNNFRCNYDLCGNNCGHGVSNNYSVEYRLHSSDVDQYHTSNNARQVQVSKLDPILN